MTSEKKSDAARQTITAINTRRKADGWSEEERERLRAGQRRRREEERKPFDSMPRPECPYGYFGDMYLLILTLVCLRRLTAEESVCKETECRMLWRDLAQPTIQIERQNWTVRVREIADSPIASWIQVTIAHDGPTEYVWDIDTNRYELIGPLWWHRFRNPEKAAKYVHEFVTTLKFPRGTKHGQK